MKDKNAFVAVAQFIWTPGMALVAIQLGWNDVLTYSANFPSAVGAIVATVLLLVGGYFGAVFGRQIGTAIGYATTGLIEVTR